MKIKVDKDISLQKIRLKSAREIFECMDHSRKTLREWLPWVDETKSYKDTEKFIRAVHKSRGYNKQMVFEVIFRKKIAGLIGLKDMDMLNNKAEIGYWLGAEAVGKGVMSRSCNAMLRFSFEELGMNRIQIKCAADNIRSCNIPKQIGFSFEGVERQGEFVHGIYRDLKVYSLLKKEWKKK
jgi:ribosomal-protein-serine acetyltransferase